MKAEDVDPEAITMFGPVMVVMMQVVLSCARQRGRFDMISVVNDASPHMFGVTTQKAKRAECYNEAIRVLAWEALTVLVNAKILKQLEPWPKCDKPWQKGAGFFCFADGVE